jgi:hypothetical protein
VTPSISGSSFKRFVASWSGASTGAVVTEQLDCGSTWAHSLSTRENLKCWQAPGPIAAASMEAAWGLVELSGNSMTTSEPAAIRERELCKDAECVELLRSRERVHSTFCRSLVDVPVKPPIDHAVLQKVSALDGSITQPHCSRLPLTIG